MRDTCYIVLCNRVTTLVFSLFMVLTLSLGCYEDNIDSLISTENNIGEGSAAPVPGNLGIIITSGITETSVQLMWTKASDSLTSQENLQYRVVVSANNNINSVLGAELFGTAVTDWTNDISSVAIDDLSPLTTYYFNVIVRNSLGVKAVYTTVSAATTGNMVYMFSAGRSKGDLGSRDSLDNRCISSKTDVYATLPCNTVRAFTSFSSSDSIIHMPDNYDVPTTVPIKGPTGITIADNWSDLFDHEDDPLLSNLADAEVSGGDWWSNSESDGTYVDFPYNCNGHTSDADDYEGWGGDSHYTGSEWLNNEMGGGEHPCSEQLFVVCICWAGEGNIDSDDETL